MIITLLKRNFLPFIRAGLLAFDGLSMLPYLENIARRKAGLDEKGFVEVMGLAQVFPGPLAVNMAAILGYRMRGLLGAALAIAGVCLPGLTIAGLVFFLTGSVLDEPLARKALLALKTSMVGIILGTVVSLGRKTIDSASKTAVFLGCLAFSLWVGTNPAITLVLGGILGVLLLRGGEAG